MTQRLDIEKNNGKVNKNLTKDSQQEYILGNEEDGVSIWSLGFWAPAMIKNMKEITNLDYPHFFVFEGDHMMWFASESVAKKFAEDILDRQKKDYLYFSKICKNVVLLCDKLYEFSDKIRKIDPKKLDNNELKEIFIKHKDLVCDILGWGMIPVLTDFPYQLLSNYAINLIKEKMEKNNIKDKTPNDYFNDLTSVFDPNIQYKEKENLRKIAWKILNKKGKFKDEDEILDTLQESWVRALIKFHKNEFERAYYGYTGPVLNEKKIEEELIDLLKNKNKLLKLLEEDEIKEEKILAIRKNAENKLKLSFHEKRLFEGIRDIIRMKTYRRDSISYSFYVMSKYLVELSNRFGIRSDLIQNMLTGEIIMLFDRKIEILEKELLERKKFAIVDATSDDVVVLSGEVAKKFFDKYYKPIKVENIKELKGQTAYPGKAIGIVKIINVPEEMEKMKEGDILISIATTPEIVPSMKKASAIVTEQGGITSHAAIVSRELEIPCVVGTKIATKVFKDGDYIEVDATNGIVKKLTKEEYYKKINNIKNKSIKKQSKIVKVNLISDETIKEKLKPDLIVWFKDINKEDIILVGGKGASLGEMFKKFSIPNGFCITVNAYKKFLKDNGLEKKIFSLLSDLDIEDTNKLERVSKEIQNFIIEGDISFEIKEEIVNNYKKLTEKFVAVRSSATAEDLLTASFAGQHATYLNVKGEEALLDAVKKCWASLFTSRAIYYRAVNGFNHENVFIAVVIQEMINSDKAGVMFSINPINKNLNEVVIEASFGLGESVVSGLVNPDYYIIDKGSLKIKEKKINEKNIAIIRDNNGGNRKIILDKTKAVSECLTEQEVKRLAKLAIDIENYYKKPQDIEWAIDSKGNIYILQSRAITTL